MRVSAYVAVKEDAVLKKRIAVGLVVTIVGIAAVTTVAIQKYSHKLATAIAMAQTPNTQLTGKAAEAMRQASNENKYLFLFIYEKDDAQTRASRKTFETTLKKIDAHWIAIDKNSSEQQGFIRKNRLTAAPMPFILAIAPNGAITAGTQDATEERLRKSMVSPGFQGCLKALQDQKLVLLCIQNGSTKYTEEALRGINDFMAEKSYSATTEIIKVDPADPAEKAFLTKLLKKPIPEEATTILLSPPGSIVASFQGAITKNDITAALQKSSASGTEGAASGSGAPRR